MNLKMRDLIDEASALSIYTAKLPKTKMTIAFLLPQAAKTIIIGISINKSQYLFS